MIEDDLSICRPKIMSFSFSKSSGMRHCISFLIMVMKTNLSIYSGFEVTNIEEIQWSSVYLDYLTIPDRQDEAFADAHTS